MDINGIRHTLIWCLMTVLRPLSFPQPEVLPDWHLWHQTAV